MIYLTDGRRHLICEPYSIAGLHAMADALGIKRGWFHRDHYDIPARRIAEITARCEVVSPKTIVETIRRHNRVYAGAPTNDRIRRKAHARSANFG